MKIQLLSTKNGMKSNSLKRLAMALSPLVGYKVWRTTKSRLDRLQLRYGDAVDKLEQYKWFHQQGLSTLEFTQDSKVAIQWQKDGFVALGRKLLNASCGAGIVIFNPYGDADMGLEPNGQAHGCPVYTKYKKKKREFRVHIFKDKVVAIVEKRLRKDWPGGPSKIRNLANGYIFCQDFELSEPLRSRINLLAMAASKVSGSDFKGVDLGYNKNNDDLFVIEVNSAPGIEGSNVDKYVAEILNAI